MYIFLIIFSIIIILIIIFNRLKYNFVIKNSVGLKELNQINDLYKFYIIHNYDLMHDYDNENYFNNVSCEDYLIYFLKNNKAKIEKCIDYTRLNRKFYDQYINKVESIEKGKFLNKSKLFSLESLKNKEDVIFNKKIQNPQTHYSIEVTLYNVDMSGRYKDKKVDFFSEEDLLYYIDIFKCSNGYYSEEIWDSISKVERAKVSNKLRFAIYKRDHYRCRLCGKYNPHDLEIDHIIPIARGGKTEYNNLQSLCHKCNQLKSDKIIYK